MFGLTEVNILFKEIFKKKIFLIIRCLSNIKHQFSLDFKQQPNAHKYLKNVLWAIKNFYVEKKYSLNVEIHLI